MKQAKKYRNSRIHRLVTPAQAERRPAARGPAGILQSWRIKKIPAYAGMTPEFSIPDTPRHSPRKRNLVTAS